MTTYWFFIFSPKYGLFLVTVPLRFKSDINSYRWYVHRDPNRSPGRQFQVVANTDGGKLSLHRLIWRLADNQHVPLLDHKDGQPLNNAEENIRAATWSQNAANRTMLRAPESGIRGVRQDKQTGRWIAKLKFNGDIRQAYFATIEEARTARNAWANEIHGQFAVMA